MDRPLTYLDYNATAPLRPGVRTAVTEAMAQFGNPSSVHRAGRAARAIVEDARETLARAVGGATGQVVFTSGGTEANALALRGLAKAMGARTVLAASIEHTSVLAHVGATSTVRSNHNGIIGLSDLAKILDESPKPALIALMAANNETGVIQPVAEVVAMARQYGARVHCDAVQALGKVPFDIKALGVDSASFSAHKLGGLKGCGALVLAPGLEIAADVPGGGQERRRRAGTENTVGIAAFGAALRDLPELLADAHRIAALRDDLERQIAELHPGVRVYGAGAPRLPNTSCLGLAGLTSETQLIGLDLAGIAVSAGAACSSGKVAASHVLLAMGINPAEANCAIRVSLGWDTTADDIARFVKAWRALADRQRPAGALAAKASA